MQTRDDGFEDAPHKKRRLLLCSAGNFLPICVQRDHFPGSFPFGADFFSLHLGMKQFLYDQIQQYHTIPYWNPYVFGGMPFWAHLESTIFYPLDILFWLMPPERAYGYTVFFHVYLAGAFMFLFCRTIGIRASGALVSALCFMFSGLMMATVYDGQMFRVQAFTWLPLILFFVYRALFSDRHLLQQPYGRVLLGNPDHVRCASGRPVHPDRSIPVHPVHRGMELQAPVLLFESGQNPGNSLCGGVGDCSCSNRSFL